MELAEDLAKATGVALVIMYFVWVIIEIAFEPVVRVFSAIGAFVLKLLGAKNDSTKDRKDG